MRLRVFAPFTLLLVLAACQETPEGVSIGAPSDKDEGASSLPVSVATVSQQTLSHAVVASGPVSAWEEMQLGVELSGLRITTLPVDVGQRVRRGQVLLELDHRMLDSELASSRAALNEARVGTELAQANLRRGQALGASQMISQSALDELRANVASAQARQATARAQNDTAQLRRDFASLHAPQDGIISKRLVQPGQVVAAGTELLRLIRDGRLEWRADLSEAQLGKVKVGAQVELVSSGETVAGIVRAVSPGLDSQTRTGTVYVDLPQPGALQVGSFVEGRIQTAQSPALAVPTSAVVQRDGFPVVFTLDAQNKVKKIRVKTGSTSKGWIEVIEGVREGDRVVQEGAGFLGDGDTVRVVESSKVAQ
jgi:RND family efflux transporter MFP subunit